MVPIGNFWTILASERELFWQFMAPKNGIIMKISGSRKPFISVSRKSQNSENSGPKAGVFLEAQFYFVDNIRSLFQTILWFDLKF